MINGIEKNNYIFIVTLQPLVVEVIHNSYETKKFGSHCSRDV